MMKTYQVNVRADQKLENLKVCAKNKDDALALAYDCYNGYVKARIVKEYKVLNAFPICQDFGLGDNE